MCRHCERIQLDIQHKETVHKFMLACAAGINRNLGERKIALLKPITPDDIEIKLEVTAKPWMGFRTVEEQRGWENASARVIEMLTKMWE